jgi:hypothetical protein
MSWSCPHTTETESECEAWAGCDEPPAKVTDWTLVAAQNGKILDATQKEKGIQVHKDWQQIVEKYTACLLSKESDKLPAISGLAATTQQAVEDTYNAGVWKSRLPQDLLWIHRRSKSTFVRQSAFKAPSWSWASVEGPVTFLKTHDAITELSITYVEPPESSITRLHPALKIRSWIMLAKSIRYRQSGNYFSGYDRFLPWACLPQSLWTSLDDLENIPRENVKGVPGEPMELINTWFLFLTLNEGLVSGLIILPVLGHPGHFQRIGVFEGLPTNEPELRDRISGRHDEVIADILSTVSSRRMKIILLWEHVRTELAIRLLDCCIRLSHRKDRIIRKSSIRKGQEIYLI